MKTYRGIVKGTMIVLEEKPDLPDEGPALVEIKLLDQAAKDEEIGRRQLELLKHPIKAESSSTDAARTFMPAGERLIDTNGPVHASGLLDTRK